MFLVDDLLFAPFKGFYWIARKIHEAAEEERAGEAEAITQALTDLYMQLETQAITEEEFTIAEKRLLDRLDGIGGEGDAAESEGDVTEPNEDRS